MLVNREVLLAKVETTYNTDAVPTEGANAILVESISLKPTSVRMIDRAAIRESLAPLKPIYGGRLAELTFDVELKGSGTAGTAPELGVLLRGCGMGETIVASTSVTYAPVSTGFESLTFYLYQDGIRTVVTGARGNITGAVEAGNTGKLSFTFTGHVADPTDTAIPAPSYSSAVPSVAVGINFTVGGYAAAINSFTFDLTNEIVTPNSISEADGYGEIRIGKRAVKGSIDPEAQLVATKDFISEWSGGTSSALAANSIGGTAGNICSISMPAVVYREVADGERDGIRTYDISFDAVESSGDDEISIVFT